MARRKKFVPIPVEKWCSCTQWWRDQWMLTNHDKMNFCVFCGKKLVKEKQV